MLRLGATFGMTTSGDKERSAPLGRSWGPLDALTAEMTNDTDAAISVEQAAEVLSRHYGMNGRVTPLSGERDRNFLVSTDTGERFILKIAGPSELSAVTDLQLATLRWLAASGCDLTLPRLQNTVGHADSVTIADASGRPRIGRLLSYVPGTVLRAPAYSNAQLAAAGEVSGKLTLALAGFDHEAARREILWDVVHGYRLAPMIEHLPTTLSRSVAHHLVGLFESVLADQVARVPQQVVHNDLNSGNLMTHLDDPEVIDGVIDFGDILWTTTIVDPAVGAASLLSPGCNLHDSLSTYLTGYCRHRKPTLQEFALFPRLVAMRLLMIMVIPAWHRENNPNNPHYGKFDAEVGSRTEWIGQLLELSGADMQP